MNQPAEENHERRVSEVEPPDLDRPASVAPSAGPGEADDVHDPYAALRLPDYRLYSFGWFISTIGHQIQSVAVGYEIYQRTGSALSIGLAALVQALPVVLLALPAGHVADRFDRRRVVQLSLALAAVCSLALAYVSWRGMPVSWMYALLALNTVARTLGWPARASLLPQVVPHEVFNNAVTWNSSFFHTASVVGPLLAGPVIKLTAAPAAYGAYLLNAAGDVLLMAMLAWLTLRPVARCAEPPGLRSLLAGVRFVWRTKVILATITLDLFAVLFGGATYLLPVVAEEILRVGPVGLSWLRASFGLGAIVGSILIAYLPPMRRAGLAMLWAVTGFGVATIVFGLSESMWLSLAALAVAGAFDTVSVVVRHTLIQALPPDSMRGRVAAVNTVFIGASNELGGAESGLTAAMFGTARAIVLGGIGTIAVVLAVAGLWPQVRTLGSLKDIRPMRSDEPATDAALPAANSA